MPDGAELPTITQETSKPEARRFYAQFVNRGVTPVQFGQLDVAMRLAGYVGRESAGGLNWHDAPFRRPPGKGEGGCGGAGSGGGGCGG